MRKYASLVLLIFLASTTLLISQNQITKQLHNQKNQSVQDNSSFLKDSAIVMPENLDENISTLLSKWQVDFSETKSQCKQGSNIVYSDSVYMQRLYNLPTEMELSFNPVVRSYIEMYTARRRDLVSYMLSLGNYYYPMFEEALERYGLPLELKYLPVIESALNPVAVSRMGATGLWQFMLRTGQQYNLEVNSLVDDRRDPYKATEAAARYLNDLFKIYKDWNLVIAAYNCGPGNVNKAIARSGGKRDYWDIYYRLPRETRGYVPAFIAATYVMNYNDIHHICPQETSSDFLSLDTVHVTKEMHFMQISEVIDIPLEEIRRYNPQFKRDIIPGNYKPYTLVLPTTKMYAFINKSHEIVDHKKSVYLTNRMLTLTDQYAGTVAEGNVINTYYKVKRGDTLGAIAIRNRTSVAHLQRINAMRSTRLSIGKRLIVKQTVKPVEPKAEIASSGDLKNTYYRVKRGDTLGALASTHSTTVAQLKLMNGLNSSTLSVGSRIVVKQEKVEAESAKKIDRVEIGIKYPRIELSSSSKSIMSDYIDKFNEESDKNPHGLNIL